ncbi:MULTISPECIES: YcgL domain-containing protein [Oleiagrimonas]|jgi:uncharacterized protein|uniref:YcgL domain-containing protein n=1 Tax=Oleiagrimonas citrea TaxID=1665687 RepID=A0A846ZPF5_9GAMM|nr:MULTISPECIES: YcgL domain-containing protein [Oleiagrimonas]NKZ39916.1 YcgL domain-containing protein [Oleiagrimonas citrea]RAP57030.1 hypothetical protein BTJ49_12525 [Oleiagrimonas sp. MCCC 1A03011]
MHCHVYASRRKTETYLWLRDPEQLEHLPEALQTLLGELRFVLEVELDAARKLPHQDTEQVLCNLREQGWHLQLPPGENA